MARMTIAVDIPDGNPTLEDPETIAENVVACYEETRDANGKGPDYPEVKFIEAEWDDA